jgi:hypothetical protein
MAQIAAATRPPVQLSAVVIVRPAARASSIRARAAASISSGNMGGLTSQADGANHHAPVTS